MKENTAVKLTLKNRLRCLHFSPKMLRNLWRVFLPCHAGIDCWHWEKGTWCWNKHRMEGPRKNVKRFTGALMLRHVLYVQQLGVIHLTLLVLTRPKWARNHYPFFGQESGLWEIWWWKEGHTEDDSRWLPSSRGTVTSNNTHKVTGTATRAPGSCRGSTHPRG